MPYAEERFRNEAHVYTGYLEARLATEEFLSGSYLLVWDMATWPWISRYEWQQIDLTNFPNLYRWYQQIAEREAVQLGYHVPAYVNDIPMP